MLDMIFRDCIDDIAAAQKALNDSLLLSAFKNKTHICDVYCLPSHNHQTFFLQVYKDEHEWILVYAKPFVDGMVAMRTFKDAIKAHRGDIYCGVKRVPIDNPIIGELAENLPLQNEVQTEYGIIIDGITTYIKNYRCASEPILFFYKVKSLPDELYSAKQKEFLENLYIQIEMIIGNLCCTNTQN